MTTRWKGVSHHRSMFSQQFNPKLAVVVSFPGLATGSQPHSTSLVWARTNHMKGMIGIKKKTPKNKPQKDTTLLRVYLGEFLSPGYCRDSQSVVLSEAMGKLGKEKGRAAAAVGAGTRAQGSCSTPEPPLPWIAWQPCTALEWGPDRNTMHIH